MVQFSGSTILGAAVVFGYGYRLTLLFTPASYERALELAVEFGLPSQLVEEQYRKGMK